MDRTPPFLTLSETYEDTLKRIETLKRDSADLQETIRVSRVTMRECREAVRHADALVEGADRDRLIKQG